MKKKTVNDTDKLLNGDHDELKLKQELKETVFDRFIMIISTIAFCLVLLFVALQIFVRYIPTISISWTEEGARYLMIFFTLFGSAVAFRKREHVTITTLIDRLPVRIRLLLEFAICFIILALLIIIIPGSYNNTLTMINSRVGAISWLRVGHIYGCMTLAFILIAIYQLRWIIYYGGEVYKSFFKQKR